MFRFFSSYVPKKPLKFDKGLSEIYKATNQGIWISAQVGLSSWVNYQFAIRLIDYNTQPAIYTGFSALGCGLMTFVMYQSFCSLNVNVHKMYLKEDGQNLLVKTLFKKYLIPIKEIARTLDEAESKFIMFSHNKKTFDIYVGEECEENELLRSVLSGQVVKLSEQAALAEDELKIETLREGDKKGYPKAGQTAKVHYTGKFEDGSIFDSSRDRGQPFEFQVGVGKVISAWDICVPQMSRGQRVSVTAPPQFAYGPRGAGDVIPPNATLIFDIELISFR